MRDGAVIRRTPPGRRLVGTLMVGAARGRADRVADAVVPRLAAPQHRPRGEAVPQRRAHDRPARRQPVLRLRPLRRGRRRVRRARRRGQDGRGRLQRLPARLARHRHRSASRSTAPRVHLVATASGWNIRRAGEGAGAGGGPRGPDRPISLPSIEIVDGARHASTTRRRRAAYRLPRGSTASTSRRHSSTRRSTTRSTLSQLQLPRRRPGSRRPAADRRIAVREDNLYLEKLVGQDGRERRSTSTASSRATCGRPSLKLVTDGDVSLPEVGRVVPALRRLRPAPGARREGQRAAGSPGARPRREVGGGRRQRPSPPISESPDFAFAGHVARRAAESRADAQEPRAAERHHRRRAKSI